MKSYTDLDQSKKLAEILPIESADQTWERIAIAGANLDVPEEMEYWHNGNTPCFLNSKIGVPCWSLAALLELLPYPILSRSDVNNFGCKIFKGSVVVSSSGKNAIDACVEMIVKLKEKELL